MSRIFAAVAVATTLFVGAVAFGTASENSGSQNEQLDGIVELLASGIEITSLIPIVLLAGLLIATLGVLART